MDISRPGAPHATTSPAPLQGSGTAAERAEEQLRTWQARTWRTVGTVSIAIGLINAFIPLLPTTVFLLIGAWAYGKGDPRLRERLLGHPRFGPGLRRWMDHRQISIRGKIAACTGIGASAALTFWALGPRPVVWAVLAGLAGLSLYLVSRPTAPAIGSAA